MKKTSRILAMLLIAVFAFSQLPMAALAAEEASDHDTMISDTQDIGTDSGGSEPDIGAGEAASILGEGDDGDEGGDEEGKSVEVATWEAFKGAIADPDVDVITIIYNFDADSESDPIEISRAIRITSESEQIVNLKNASIKVISEGSLTLDGALVLLGVGEQQIIEVQEGGEATINGNVKIEAEWYGVRINGGKVNIDGGTISGPICVWVENGTVTLSGEAKILATGTATGVYVKDGTETIKNNVEIIADGEAVGG